jgi:hypothetical protein
MRYPISFSRPFRPLFSLFGFSPARSYVELDDQALHLHFGTAHQRVALEAIAGVDRYDWPFYFGLGAKLGPNGGVSYVGSTEGVVKITFVEPRPMNVWGPFKTSRARSAVVSLQQADQFVADLRSALGKTAGA